LGSVDLGIRAQLAEIERGFFDRAHGPHAKSLDAKGLDTTLHSRAARSDEPGVSS
jgi:hypothetical protein